MIPGFRTARRRRTRAGATPRTPRPRPRWTGSRCGSRDHRQAQAVRRRDRVQHGVAAGRGFRVRTRTRRPQRSGRRRSVARRASRTRTAAVPRSRAQRGVPVVVNHRRPDLVVVEAGARERAVGEEEAERPHEVEPAAGVRAQAQHVAGVRRDLGLVEDDVEHRGISAGPGPRDDPVLHPGRAGALERPRQLRRGSRRWS